MEKLTSKYKRLTIPTSEGIEVLHISQIVRIEAKGAYSVFFFTNGNKLTVARTLKDVEIGLPTRLFFRVHHSHIVNLDHILRFHKTAGGSLLMVDQSNIPVSRQKKVELIERLTQ